MSTSVKVAPPDFRPVQIRFEDPQEFADFFGALYAYARGKTKAGKGLREMGLDKFYSGNAREYARKLCAQIANQVGLPKPKFPERRRGDEIKPEDYMNAQEQPRAAAPDVVTITQPTEEQR